jgi:hypothetical protein
MIIIRKNRIVNISIAIIAIIALFFGGYFYYKLHKIETSKDVITQKELENVLGKVSRLYLVPEGEIPTMATVSDPSLLQGQSFFSAALKGDKVLIFSKAGRAVLYRPSIDKIIEITAVKSDSLQY